MKKIISLLLVAVICIGLVSCNFSSTQNGDTNSIFSEENHTVAPPKDNGSDSNNDSFDTGSNGSGAESNGSDPDKNEPNTDKKFNIDLAGYVANIGNASALGIAKSQFKKTSPALYGGGIELLSAVRFLESESVTDGTVEDTPEEPSTNSESKNYIVMSTTEYSAGTPEADANGLTKVSFTKTITENVTTETTGTKYITASEGQITILAVSGFTYTVYKGEELVLSNVQDNCESDKNEEEGVIVLTDLEDGTEYRVDYFGIGEEITVTQDELGGEIDKLYSLYGYTFISFVPEGMSARPTGADIQYDCFGVDMYDKSGYFSDDTHQSFVIDNKTGYVYAIENFSIDHIENGVIVSDGKHYDMEAQVNGELTFSKIVRNETIEVHSVYKDKHGHKYVHNDTLEGYDADNKTVYYKTVEYYLSSDGTAIYVEVDPMYHDVWFNPTDIPKIYKSIKVIESDFSKRDITSDESYRFVFMHGKIGEHEKVKFGFIESGYFYAYITKSPYYYSKTDLSTMETECVFDTNGTILIDHNSALFLIEGTLYYGQLWGTNAYVPGSTSNLTQLIANCSIDDSTKGNAWQNIRFRYTTFTETVFYKIILDENGTPQVVSETYVAPEREIITLQPLNK